MAGVFFLFPVPLPEPFPLWEELPVVLASSSVRGALSLLSEMRNLVCNRFLLPAQETDEDDEDLDEEDEDPEDEDEDPDDEEDDPDDEEEDPDSVVKNSVSLGTLRQYPSREGEQRM